MTDERIIAYLLEELPEAERERFEEECFDLNDWPAQLDSVEEDLIDDYLRGQLTPERRGRFEQNYLTTEARAERVGHAALLLRHLSEILPATSEAGAQAPTHAASATQAQILDADAQAPTAKAETRAATAAAGRAPTWAERWRTLWAGQSWAMRAAAAAVVVAIVLGAAWWLARPRGPRTFAAVTLVGSVSNRAEGARAGTVKLPLNADALKVFLTLPEGVARASRYRVELEDEDGRRGAIEVAEYDEKTVAAVVPAERLARGRYALKLYAVNADGTEQPAADRYFLAVE